MKLIKEVVNKQYVFGFMDETGLLHSPITDKVFALGLIKLQHPKDLHRAIINFKNKKKFHQEFHFNEVNNYNWRLYLEFVRIFFDASRASFHSLVFDKSKLDIKQFFKGNHDHAYNAYTAKLIAGALSKGEYIVVIADDVNTPKSDNFEKEVKKKVKNKVDRNALFGIVRVESHAVSEIQMVDVLLGLVGYAFKIKYGLLREKKPAKLRLLKEVQNLLGVKILAIDLKKKIKGGGAFEIKEFLPLEVKK